MASETTTGRRVLCPVCRTKGKRVRPVTLHALLRDEYRNQLPRDKDGRCESEAGGCKRLTGDTGWRFCHSPDCDLVYFAERGDTRFMKPQLKVAVGVKETAGERPLCYCFGHSIGSVKDELRTQRRSHALENIRAKMKDPGCRCETENPSGSCCLGSVAKGIQIAEEELGMTVARAEPVQTAKDVPSSLTPSRPPTGRGEKIAKVGTLASAIMASSCCWLPLVLLAVGVSGAGIAATLEAYRPLFIVVTFGFLAAAFYFTYRPKKAASEAGHGCCPPEPSAGGGADAACCAPTQKCLFSMMAMNKVMLWAVTVLAVAFLLFPHYVGALLGTSGGGAAVMTPDMNRAVLQIEGMTCEGCATMVAQAIRQVPGVLAVEVSYEHRQVVVGAEACSPVPKDKILATLKKARYSGTALGEEDSRKDRAGAPYDSPPAEARHDQASVSGTTLSVSGMT